jgi:(p)ppGpp synthase/HD superfamily hydrolase
MTTSMDVLGCPCSWTAYADEAAPTTERTTRSVTAVTQPTMDWPLIQAAARYAEDAHADDIRKGSNVPYVSHLWSVGALVMENGGDSHQVAAGLLHDVVEDHGGLQRLADVRTRFGDDVAHMVEGLSDSVVDTDAGESKPPWAERKTAYVAHLATVDGRTALVSAADKLHNLRSIVADYRAVGPELWLRFKVHQAAAHLWYYRSLVTILEPRVPTVVGTWLDVTFISLAALVEATEPGTDLAWTPSQS